MKSGNLMLLEKGVGNIIIMCCAVPYPHNLFSNIPQIWSIYTAPYVTLRLVVPWTARAYWPNL